MNLEYANGELRLSSENQSMLKCQLLGPMASMTLGACGVDSPEFSIMILITSEITVGKMLDPSLYAAGDKELTIADYIEKQLSENSTAEVGQLRLTRASCPAGSNAVIALIKSGSTPGSTQPASCTSLEFN
jgi:hypothetical protein